MLKKINIEHFSIALITLFIFIKTLVFPSKGTGIIDSSLLGNDSGILKYYLVFIFVINLLFFLYIACIRKNMFAWFLIIFNAALLPVTLFFMKNGANTSNITLLYVYGNLILSFTFLGFTIFAMDNYKAIKPLIFYTLIFIFLVYAVSVISKISLTNRLDVLYLHSNHLGNALSFGILFLSFSIFSFKNKILKCLVGCVVFVLCLGLVATLSRGAWLGLGIGLLFGITIAFVYSKNKVNILKIVLGLVLAFSISAIIINPSRITERFDMSVKDTEISTMNRATLWKASLKIIKDHPLIGVGLGNFGDVLDKDYKTEFLNNESFATALNNYLTLAAEVGIPLALLYIFIVIYALVLAAKAIAQCRKEESPPAKSDNKFLAKIVGFVRIDNYFYIKVGMLAGVISLLVFGLTTYTLTRVYSNLLLWSSLGYILADYKSKCSTVVPSANTTKTERENKSDSI